jgi:NAD(P)-dependent dehydrogenase (short-subunit alcohol dehydrogenase family)
MGTLEGRIAVVTGGTGGVGRRFRGTISIVEEASMRWRKLVILAVLPARLYAHDLTDT